MSKLTQLLVFLITFSILSPAGIALAADRVVVIPLAGSKKPLKNIVTVAKGNGDFTDLVAAVDSITDASANNPYLVIIAPGEYSFAKTLAMKEYVDISGSGENVTRLIGAIGQGTYDASSAIVEAANHATLSNLSVVNTGDGEYSIGIYTTGLNATAKLQQVTVMVSGWYNVYGVHNSDSSPEMFQVEAIASEGYTTIGINNVSSSPRMREVTASATFTRLGVGYTYGIRNQNYSDPIMTRVTTTAEGGRYIYGLSNSGNSSPTMTEVIVKASGSGLKNWAIYLDASSSPIMTGVSATASGGDENTGISLHRGSYPTIRRSTVSGTEYAILDDAGYSITGQSIRISQSTLIGAVVGNDTYACIACDDDKGGEIPGDCGREDIP
ncbi:MAG: hypothetical protein KJ804_17440 [Proteobacteria bacterium]|nr:hypothetical protein [Pseudomonadota bacterium]MBU1060091.1 hypothetical protein [Pseudomonadota bacterium]